MGKIWVRFLFVSAAFLLFGTTQNVYSQRVALKTNALYWATATPNIGAELVLSRRMSLDLSLGFNPFKFGDTKLNMGYLQPELKYWLQRPMTRHYIGVAALYLENDLKLGGKVRDGSAIGGGLTYGYSFILSSRWNMELNCGVGYMKYSQKKYSDGEEIPEQPNLEGSTIAPIKLGVCFSYILK